MSSTIEPNQVAGVRRSSSTTCLRVGGSNEVVINVRHFGPSESSCRASSYSSMPSCSPSFKMLIAAVLPNILAVPSIAAANEPQAPELFAGLPPR